MTEPSQAELQRRGAALCERLKGHVPGTLDTQADVLIAREGADIAELCHRSDAVKWLEDAEMFSLAAVIETPPSTPGDVHIVSVIGAYASVYVQSLARLSVRRGIA